MSNIGELLKRTREEQGLSIHEVSLALKINSKILQAIEDGDKNHLPAKTFLRGFVRSYASYLHLDQKSTMDAFSNEYGSTLPKSNARPAPETPAQDKGNITESVTSHLNLTKPHDGGATQKTANLNDHPLSPKLKSIAKEQSVESDVKNNLRWYLIGGAVTVIVGLTLARNLAEKYAKEADTSQLTADLQKAALKGGTVSTQHLQATIEPERGPEPRSILDVKHGHGEFVPVTNIPATNVAVGNIPVANMPALGGPAANGPENMMAANQSRALPATPVGVNSINPAIPAKDVKVSEVSLTAAKPVEKAQSSPTPSLKKLEAAAVPSSPHSSSPSMSSANGNYSFAFGNQSKADFNDSVALGHSSKALYERSVAIGYGAETSQENEIVIGSCDSVVTLKGSKINIGGGCGSDITIPGIKQFIDSMKLSLEFIGSSDSFKDFLTRHGCEDLQASSWSDT
jgi:cytoskeleton protein RodZ